MEAADDMKSVSIIPKSPTNSSVGGSSSSSSTDLVGAFVAKNSSPDPADKVQKLKLEREKLKAERKKVQRELRNEDRRRARLKSKAKKLTASELVQVLSFRAEQAAKKEEQKDVATKAKKSTACK